MKNEEWAAQPKCGSNFFILHSSFIRYVSQFAHITFLSLFGEETPEVIGQESGGRLEIFALHIFKNAPEQMT